MCFLLCLRGDDADAAAVGHSAAGSAAHIAARHADHAAAGHHLVIQGGLRLW